MVGQRDDETQQYGSVSCIPKAFVHDSLAVKMHHVFEISAVVQRNGLLDEPHWTRPWSEKHRAFLQLQWHRKAHGNEEFPKRKDKES